MRRDDLVGEQVASQDDELNDSGSLRWSSYARHMCDRNYVDRCIDRPTRTSFQAEKGRKWAEEDLCCEHSSRSIRYTELGPYRLPTRSRPSVPPVAVSEPISPTLQSTTKYVQTTKWDYLRGPLEERAPSIGTSVFRSRHAVSRTVLPASRSPCLRTASTLNRSTSSRDCGPRSRWHEMEETSDLVSLPSISDRNTSQRLQALPPVSRILSTRHSSIPKASHVKYHAPTIESRTRHQVLARLRHTTKQRLRAKLANNPSI